MKKINKLSEVNETGFKIADSFGCLFENYEADKKLMENYHKRFSKDSIPKNNKTPRGTVYSV